MMLVSVLTFSQYPTTKIINGESVVIMTLKQGQDINTKFTKLNSEIQELSKEVSNSRVEQRYLENKITRMNKEHQLTRDSLLLMVNERNFYKKEYDRIKNLEFADKKARVHMKIGLFVLVATWVTFILTSVK